MQGDKSALVITFSPWFFCFPNFEKEKKRSIISLTCDNDVVSLADT